jgi:hypothetical protein
MEMQVGAMRPVAEEMSDHKDFTEVVAEMKQHAVDVHCTVPLLFRRYYFVFSSGQDRRKEILIPVESEKRAQTLTGDLALLAFGLVFISAFFGMIIYRILHLAG